MKMHLAEESRSERRVRRERVAEVVKRHTGSYRLAYSIAGWLIEGWDDIKQAVEGGGGDAETFRRLGEAKDLLAGANRG